MKTLHAILVLSLAILATTSSVAGIATPPPAGSPEAALLALKHRLEGSTWTFANFHDPKRKEWVRFEENGKLYVGWAESSFGKWKVTGDHTVLFMPWTTAHKETLVLDASLRSGTVTNDEGMNSKMERK